MDEKSVCFPCFWTRKTHAVSMKSFYT